VPPIPGKDKSAGAFYVVWLGAGFFLYGFLSLIGWREAVTDIAAGLALRYGVGTDVTRQLAEESTV